MSFELSKEEFLKLRNGVAGKSVVSKVVTGDVITGEQHEITSISDARTCKPLFSGVGEPE